MHGEMKNTHKIIIGVPECKRQPARPRHRCAGNNKIKFKTGRRVCSGYNWLGIGSSDEPMNMCINVSTEAT
jgi:hypothetical protein